MSASGANLGPKGQCDLTFRLGSKQHTDRFMVLQDLHRNIIVGLNWQCSVRIGCNWNVNGQQYITHNNKFLCTSTASSNMEPIVQNSGALILQPRTISVISGQAPTKVNTKYLYQLYATDDLPSGIIPLAVEHKIDHRYPRLLKIPLFNTKHNAVHIPRKTIIGNLWPIEVEDFWSQQNFMHNRWHSWYNKYSNGVAMHATWIKLSARAQQYNKPNSPTRCSHTTGCQGYLPHLKGNTVALFPNHLQILEEQIFSKWISQQQACQLHTNCTKFCLVMK